jgi:hypothetical protein
VGVGQHVTCSYSVGFDLWISRAFGDRAMFPRSMTRGVIQVADDEHPLASMRCADIGRA